MTKIYFQSLNIDHANLLFEYLQEDALYHYIPDQKHASIQALKERYSRLIQGVQQILKKYGSIGLFSMILS